MSRLSESLPWISTAENSLSKKLNHPVQIKSLKPVAGGSINSAGVLETSQGRYFIKWNISGPSDLFTTESQGLSALSSSGTSLIIPRPITSGSMDSTKFLIMEYLEFSGSDIEHQENLGRGLAEMHRTTTTAFGFESDNYCGLTPQKNTWKKDWTEFYLENRLGYLWSLIQKRRPFGNSADRQFASAKNHIKESIQDNEIPSLIHGDLWSGNAENTVQGPSIFDPAAYYGHREAELGMMYLFGGFSNRTIQAYDETFPLQTGWQERLEIYKLYHILNHHLLFGGGYGSQAMEIISKYL